MTWRALGRPKIRCEDDTLKDIKHVKLANEYPPFTTSQNGENLLKRPWILICYNVYQIRRRMRRRNRRQRRRRRRIQKNKKEKGKDDKEEQSL